MSEAEINAALGAHGLWKNRLKSAIATGKDAGSVQDASVDNKCKFGQWIHALTGEATRSQNYLNVLKLHSEFHRVAGEVLRLATSGNKAAAEAKMADFDNASGVLVKALMDWSKTFA